MPPLRQAAEYFRFMLEDARDPRFKAIAGAALGLIAVGSAVFWVLERWTVLDAVYFSVMTLTTVGYGDVVPRTAARKIFAIVYVIFGVGLLRGFLSLAAKRAAERLERQRMGGKHEGGSG